MMFLVSFSFSANSFLLHALKIAKNEKRVWLKIIKKVPTVKISFCQWCAKNFLAWSDVFGKLGFRSKGKGPVKIILLVRSKSENPVTMSLIFFGLKKVWHYQKLSCNRLRGIVATWWLSPAVRAIPAVPLFPKCVTHVIHICYMSNTKKFIKNEPKRENDRLHWESKFTFYANTDKCCFWLLVDLVLGSKGAILLTRGIKI